MARNQVLRSANSRDTAVILHQLHVALKNTLPSARCYQSLSLSLFERLVSLDLFADVIFPLNNVRQILAFWNVRLFSNAIEFDEVSSLIADEFDQYMSKI